jgi:hypothetical protein
MKFENQTTHLQNIFFKNKKIHKENTKILPSEHHKNRLKTLKIAYFSPKNRLN